MSEPNDKAGEGTEGTVANQNAQQQTTTAQDALSQLMGGANAPAAGSVPKPSTDLERNALRAAEEALAEGARVLAEAENALRSQKAGSAPKPQAAPLSRTRERVLRALIGLNIVGMIVLVLLPSPTGDVAQQIDVVPQQQTPVDPHAAVEPVAHEQPQVPHVAGEPQNATPEPVVQAPNLRDPVLRAFALAESRDYKAAIALLEQHLEQSPRLDAGKKANVLLALEHYAAQIGDYAKAQDYQRKLEALRGSHSLPEDLVHMAQEAERNGDIESMRRHYARLLLQQRQIPSTLYRHVAEAYLKLGDSYRTQAEKGEAAARESQLEKAREQLRKQATAPATPQSGGGHK